MALSLKEWADIAAIVSAMSDVLTVGRDTFSGYLRRHRADRNLPVKAAQLQAAFSTYSDDEIEEIANRIRRCRDRFNEEGAGKQRVRCLCSVLRDVKDGNGGQIPVDEWESIYRQLQCESTGVAVPA